MTLFDPVVIGGKTAPNRFAALPMEGNDAAPDGSPSDRTIERYRELARGGWGVIMLEAVAPCLSGRGRTKQLVLTKDTLDGFRRLVDAMREQAPDTLIFIQINHAGRYALTPQIAYRHPELDAWHKITPDTPELTTQELDIITQKMCWAADCAARTGADGADLKACHGYLGIELLRPANVRTDPYGGPFLNRARLFREMLAAIHSEISSGFLAGSRISLFEDIEGGLGDTADSDAAPLDPEVQTFIDLLRAGGATWICETAGNPYLNPQLTRPVRNDGARFRTMEQHHSLTARVKNAFPDLCLIGTGYTLFGPDMPAVASAALEQGRVDMIGLGRQNLADPLIPRKIENGDAAAVNWCKACVTNNCAWLLRNNAEVGCIVYNEYYRNRLKQAKNAQPDASD